MYRILDQGDIRQFPLPSQRECLQYLRLFGFILKTRHKGTSTKLSEDSSERSCNSRGSSSKLVFFVPAGCDVSVTPNHSQKCKINNFLLSTIDFYFKFLLNNFSCIQSSSGSQLE